MITIFHRALPTLPSSFNKIELVFKNYFVIVINEVSSRLAHDLRYLPCFAVYNVIA